mgnify:CR=1 FL=1
MWMLILNVVYVLVASAIIALVLMQRGSGAQAGSGFGGGGASGTVFGARGASNFLSKSTKWLAIAFFGIRSPRSLAMRTPIVSSWIAESRLPSFSCASAMSW